MIGWIRHIEYLLLHNDRVAVPGLGCFSVIHHEARLLPDGRSFLPPTRTIAFEAGEVSDCDLLVTSLMRSRFIARDEALAEIAEGVSTVRQELNRAQRFELGRLGYLIDTDGEITFQSSNENPLEYPRFGLAPLTIKPLEEEEKPVVEVCEEQSFNKNPDRIYISLPKRMVRVASVAAAVIVFLLMVSRPVNTTDTSVHYAGVLSSELFALSNEPVVSDANDMTDLWEPLSLSLSGETQEPRSIESAPKEEEVAQEKKDSYYIIVGALSTRASAEVQIECFHNQGATGDISIYETKNKALLYIASFETITEAQQYHTRLVKEQNLFANAWIMKAEG